MKKFVPAIIFVFALACAILLISLVIFPYGKKTIKENSIVQANDEINSFLTGEDNFDKIVSFIEADTERQHFLGVTLVKLSEYETVYELNFESRYPRYKAYRDMVKELSRHDYSEWVGSIIKGTVTTEFEANVFDYLSGLDDNRYLNDSISHFIEILDNSGSSGFNAETNREAFIIGSLSRYIMQFPGNNSVLKTALGQKADQFISLSEKYLTETRGIPLNQVYIYLYLKYFGLENLINKKMEEFLSSGTRKWDGTTWNMTAVDGLISYFSSTGKGMSPNFYSLIQTGFNKDDSIRVYIALQVLKKIGFDDPAPSFNNLLDRAARRQNDLEIITTEITNGVRSTSSSTRRQIIFSDEVAATRRAISGKTDVSFDTVLNNALKASSETGNFIIPRVTAAEVVNKEVSAMSGQYTKNFITASIKTWEKKNAQLATMRIIEIIIAIFFCCFVLFNREKMHVTDNSNILLQILPYGVAVSLALLAAFIINTAIAGG